MRPSTPCLTFLLAAAAALPAQTVETVGGTATTSSRAACGKANVFRVDQSLLLLNFEAWLNVPGQETLVFFLYRYHSKDGTYTLDYTLPKLVNGTGIGFAWYSSGTIALPLLAGNYYQLGFAWAGTCSYTYTTNTSGAPTSFGIWHRATTPAFPLATTYPTTGTDVAQYYQRLTFVPFGAAGTVGTSCGVSSPLPRTTISQVPKVNSPFSIDIADGVANAQGITVLAFNAPLPVPLPLLGCSLWINPSSIVSFPVTLTGASASVVLPVPNNPLLAGFALSTQSGVLNGATLELTNAYKMSIQ